MKRLIILPLFILLVPIQVREWGTTAYTSLAKSASARQLELLLSDYVNIIRARGQSPDDQGVLIESLEQGQLIAQHNADVTFNPASVMKLATSLVALAKLGPDYRYRTNLLADGVIDLATRTLEGDLVVEGGADPMFSLYDAQEVALQISRLGVSRVRGALRIAGQFYYFANGYRSNLSPGTSAAKFRAALQRAGIRIEGDTISGEKSGTLLLSHYSDPLVSILLYQNAHSSNAVAEVVGASLGGPRAVQDYLVRQLGLSDSEIFVGRASGLDFNRITPRATLKVLRALIKVLADHSLKPEDVMPVAGVDSGTLRSRLGGEDDRGAVVAKTGSLVSIDKGVSTLVGIAYTRASGPLLFAVFNSGGSVHAYRRLQDQFIERMIADEGGALSARRNEDALAGDTRHSIVQVFYRAGNQFAEVAAE
ncbi:MAG TPA: D-alanyl-D-alanine carboxypeptidase [Blastocatellia bacterium]|nr:D-alanyl-D-alanine carboxypeptidase [Blastocatellia bacterium]